MMNVQNIQNVNDCIPLYLPHSLYLKPVARMNISVSLPSSKIGKSISNLDIMDKLSSALKPDKFLVLKVSKSTLEFIRFEAELDDRLKLRSALARIDGVSLKIVGFGESFKVRASEAKDEFPTRHDWDSFFRDASNMDEMKAGERPDTIHFTHLPIRWFCPRHMENEENVKPSESIFRRIFEKFGRVRNLDIPICDPYRSKMNSDINGMKAFNFDQVVLFEAYVQFEEYVGFVRAMDEFRGMKLVRKFVDKTQAINIHVKFDKTKHLSDAHIQRRDRVRKRLINKAKSEDEERERQKALEAERLEKERKNEELLKLAELERQREREERRKEKHLKQIQERGQVEISQKIRLEERKLMIAQRKLESIRILENLFDRIKLKHLQKFSADKNASHRNESNKSDLRDRLVDKYKSATEKLLLEQKKKVQEIKSKTPLLGLLKIRKAKSASKGGTDSEDDDENNKRKGSNFTATSADIGNMSAPPIVADGINPFKAAVAAAAAAAAGPGPTIAAPYPTDMASEWMKSLSMLSYMPQVFPGMPLFRPSFPPHLHSYRGYNPRARARGRGGGTRGRGWFGAYDGSASSYNNYKHYKYDDDNYEVDDSYYHRSSYSRANHSRSRVRSKSTRSRSRSRQKHSRSRSRAERSRSRSRNRHFRSKSRSRSRSRTRSRQKHSRSRSRSERSYNSTRSRSRSRSKSKERRNILATRTNGSRSKSCRRSKSSQSRSNKKLVSTRRSYSSSRGSSRSRSRSTTSRAHGSKRSWSRKGERSSRRSSSHRNARVVIETDKLVRSAEHIKRNIEKDMQLRMREEEREIKESFRRRKEKSSEVLPSQKASTETNPNEVQECKDQKIDSSRNSMDRMESIEGATI